MLTPSRVFCVLIVLATQICTYVQAADEHVDKAVYPVAVLTFSERGREVTEQGRQATDLLFANLAANSKLFLVDREDLDTVLKEQELGLSGAVKSDQAAQVGQLTGAKILVTGSVLQVDASRFLIAKVIGTETSRVLGASVKGAVNEPLDILAQQLADEVGRIIVERADELVATVVAREDRIAALRKTLGGGKRPTLSVSIPETHVGQVTFDPAAETEITQFAIEAGFDVFDTKSVGVGTSDVRITGEAFSEFAGRRGDLVSVKARVEVKAIDNATGRVLAADRQAAVAVDLAEQVAAKSALQDAGAQVAERLLAKLGK